MLYELIILCKIKSLYSSHSTDIFPNIQIAFSAISLIGEDINLTAVDKIALSIIVLIYYYSPFDKIVKTQKDSNCKYC